LLRTAARQLFEAGDKQSARKILELVFASEIEEHKLVGSSFLGLAEIRLAAGDAPGALDLLRRLTLAVGNPFENLDPAAALLEKTDHNAEAIEFLDQLVKSAPWEPSYRIRLAKAKLAANTDAAGAQGSLSSVASSANVKYDSRSRAAVALAGRTHSDLGSGELNLLAGAGAIAPASADKFYFYEARIRAAEKATDAQTKMQLLNHCIVDFPRRDTARMPLFQAAVSLQSYAYAIAVFEPLFQTQFRLNYVPENASEDEQIASSGEEEENSEEPAQPAAESQLSRAQRAQVAQKIGDVMMKLDRTADALSYYQLARTLETTKIVRQVLNRKITDVRTVLRIEKDNAARQPILHEALEQDRVVRPKLLARVAGLSRASAEGGLRP
jgi:hypothetical protein